MDLEQRVQALEQEVEILKNQIQITLLAIQEQLLNQQYPTLRGEALASASVSENESSQTATSNLIKRVSLTPGAEQPAPQPVASTFSSDADTQPAKDWSLITRLEKWAAEKIDKIGAKRTRELLKLYAKQGRISPQICEELIQFVDIYETGESHKPSAAAQPALKPVPPNAKVIHGGGHNDNPQGDDKRALVMRLIDGLQNNGKQRRSY